MTTNPDLGIGEGVKGVEVLEVLEGVEVIEGQEVKFF
jgi:hypothetical protein